MAKKLNVPASQISRIENNSGNISSSIIRGIKEMDPNADLDFILGYSDQPGGSQHVENQEQIDAATTIKKLEEDLEFHKGLLKSMQEVLEMLKNQKNT